MTEVRLIFSEGVPFLIGDLLTSSEVRNRQLVLPAWFKSHHIVPDQDWFEGKELSGLKQKLCEISPYLAIGWSGYESEARLLLSELKETFKKKSNPDHQEVIQKLNECNERYNFMNLNLLGLLRHTNTVKAFKWNSKKKQTNEKDYICLTDEVIGSSHMVLPVIEAPQDSACFHLSSDNLSKLIKPLNLFSRRWAADFFSNITHKNLFGGGYEILGPNEQGWIKKINNFTIWIYGYVGSDLQNLKIFPKVAYRNYYFDEVLLIGRRLFIFPSISTLDQNNIIPQYVNHAWAVNPPDGVKRELDYLHRKAYVFEKDNMISRFHFHIFPLLPFGKNAVRIGHTSLGIHPFNVCLKKSGFKFFSANRMSSCKFFTTEFFEEFLCDLKDQIRFSLAN